MAQHSEGTFMPVYGPQNNRPRQERMEQLMKLLQHARPIPASFADTHRRFQPHPPNATPTDLFHVALNCCTVPAYRFIKVDDVGQMLMYCDGACLGNGQANPRGGCGVVVAPSSGVDGNTPSGAEIEFPLENNGIVHTSNRAELRSVIGGLGLRYWRGEGFERIVVAMDSEYVVLGISEWIHKWIANGWRTSSGMPVANKDLWEALLAKLREMEQEGSQVQFWRIPRQWNAAADLCAKRAAQKNLQNSNSAADGNEGLVGIHMIETM